MNKDMVLILRDDGHELQTAEYTARYDRNGKRTIAMGLYEKSPFSFRVERLTEDKSTGLAIGVKEGEVFIKDAFIGSGIVSANYNVKLNINNVGKLHEAGMTLGVEDGQSNVEFMADRYTVHEAASSIIENAVATSAKMKIRLSDEMKQAVIDAVRESDLFTSLQAASASDLQQAVDDAVGKALRNAVKPGGMIWSSFQLCQH
ncbi:phage tail tip fiber protein [Enterobacter kobei]|uniref:phage tail tip fiber protein n=1 Tax=Enterobacter kobei TaxID=208224 RepID=UPI0032AF4A7E